MWVDGGYMKSGWEEKEREGRRGATGFFLAGAGANIGGAVDSQALHRFAAANQNALNSTSALRLRLPVPIKIARHFA